MNITENDLAISSSNKITSKVFLALDCLKPSQVHINIKE